MTWESTLSLIFCVVSLCAAGFNAWMWWLRRTQSVHLWLAISAIGIAGMAGPLSIMQDSGDPEINRIMQRCMLGAGTFIVLGFPRFAIAFLDIEGRALRISSSGLAVLTLTFAVLPDVFFAGAPVVGDSTFVGHRIQPGGVTLLGRAYLMATFCLFVWLLRLFAQNRQRFVSESSLLFSMLCLWFVSGANDMLVAAGVFEGPLLTAAGYTGFLSAFTGILVRRMASSMDVIEQSAEHLRLLVEQRTEKLRERELQLAHGEKMATVGTLAAGVAHEINTPIAFVTSNLERMHELRANPDRTDENGSDASEILAECREGVDRIVAIVSDLLDLARRGETAEKAVDLSQVVASALPMVNAEARDRADLVSELGDVPPVLGDERQLGQIVINLVMNALQAIPRGAPLSNRVTVTTRTLGQDVALLVRDTGPGIPEDIRPRIFDPFFTTKASEGTGLGLAVTHQLVSRHRGHIELDSTPDGTTALVTLPAHTI